jgi:hypothetical protein
LFFLRKNEETLSFLIDSGANITEAGWMQILDDQFFGTPLVLAHWIKNKSDGLLMSDKILKIISNNHQSYCNNFHPRSKIKQQLSIVN